MKRFCLLLELDDIHGRRSDTLRSCKMSWEVEEYARGVSAGLCSRSETTTIVRIKSCNYDDRISESLQHCARDRAEARVPGRGRLKYRGDFRGCLFFQGVAGTHI